MNGDTPVHGLHELEIHIDQLVADPEAPLNVKLFDDVSLQLTDYNIPPLIPRFLPKLTQILSTYQKDPTILCDLAIKLIRPVPFTQALTLASENALIQALRSPSPSPNILALAVIEKASKSPNDVAILSIMKALVEQVVRTWLSSPNVGVGDRATTALGKLLEVDCDRRSINVKMDGMSMTKNVTPGQGLLWRRIFQDRNIYEMILALCSSENHGGSEEELDDKQLSLAQGRLLTLVARLANVDFQIVSRTNFPEIEKRYGMEEGEQGLLYFVALKMVDKEDYLMRETWIEFFVELLEMLSTTELSKPSMIYLAGIMNKAIDSDTSLYKSLEGIAVSPESPREMVELLVNLQNYQS